MQDVLTREEHNKLGDLINVEDLMNKENKYDFDPVGDDRDLRLCEKSLSPLQREQYVMRMIRKERGYTDINKIHGTKPTCKDILNLLRMPNIDKCKTLLGVL